MTSLKAEANQRDYSIRRPARNRVHVTRRDRTHAEIVLREWSGRRPVSWSDVARVILVDALEDPPVRKLRQDYGRFLFTPVGETRNVHGAEIQAWISTWSLPTLPGEAARAGGR